MAGNEKGKTVDDHIEVHAQELRRQTDRQNRFETQLGKVERAVTELSSEHTETTRALWESMVEINTQIGIARAQLDDFKGTMDLVQAAVKAQEMHTHGTTQYAKGRKIGWREGFWAAIGAAALWAGKEYDTVVSFLKTIGRSGG